MSVVYDSSYVCSITYMEWLLLLQFQTILLIIFLNIMTHITKTMPLSRAIYFIALEWTQTHETLRGQHSGIISALQMNKLRLGESTNLSKILQLHYNYYNQNFPASRSKVFSTLPCNDLRCRRKSKF